MRTLTQLSLLSISSLLAACAQQPTPSSSGAPAAAPAYSEAQAASKQSITTADSAAEAAPQTSSNRNTRESERLGTQWGDEVDSHVTQIDLRRVTENPIAETSLRYADKRYSGRNVNTVSLAAGKINLMVETDNGRRLPLFRDGSQYYLQGEAGKAYRLVYQNSSNNTYEIVASVDGLDVLNGQRASRYNSGYVLRPNSRLVIEGFRKSNSSVASFIFSKPNDAYAANTPQGSINNTGIIGSVVYELYDPNQRKRPVSHHRTPEAFPADNGYAPAPR